MAGWCGLVVIQEQAPFTMRRYRFVSVGQRRDDQLLRNQGLQKVAIKQTWDFAKPDVSWERP